MTPFNFTGEAAASEWRRFTTEAAKWKPSGFDTEMATRLRFYLDQQLEDTRTELVRRFPETGDKMTPVTLPVTRHLIREQAKVFLQGTKLDLVLDGEPLDSEDETAAWFEKTKQRAGLLLRLKRVDAYTHLMRTCGLRVVHVPGKAFRFQVVFPHQVRVVMDPAAPMDLDQAHGVAVEIASEAGLSSGARRWEFYCARKGEEQRGILTEREDEKSNVTVVFEPDDGDPLLAPDGRAVVPLVMFAAHTEELGLFTMEGSDLVPMNRGLNILVSDIFNIAEQQGFGVMVLTTTAGGKAPGKIVRSPNTALSLEDGVKAEFINANAPLADLVALVKTRLQMAATLYGIPPGSVALDARAVASGIALQIEMRPLTEARQDQIEVYGEPIRRLWDVLWATYNAFAEEANAPVPMLDEGLELRWTPGEIQVPMDPQVALDNILARLGKKLISRAEAIAADRGVSVEEAKEIAKRIDEEDGPATRVEPPVDPADPLGLKAKRAALGGRPPKP